AGATVALATEGATLPGGVTIRRARFRGVESRGMLCSAAELGLDPKMFPREQAEGILILDPELPLGQDVRTALGLDDVILDVEVTPNRGDCLSILGIAREVAALLGLRPQLPRPAFPEGPEAIEGRVDVEIRDPGLCRRYVARLFTDVRVGPSPLWMQLRLQAAGIRPICNMVDLTNYVMLELGQPLHAFDYDTIAEGKIIVRRAAPGETIVSLDGVLRDLEPEMLVIADARGPVAIAGVMGGEATEVKPHTRNVLLESAHFQPVSIRRTSRRLALISESSSRFEKGVDPEGCRLAADRVAELVHRLGIGRVATGIVDNYAARPTPRTVMLRPDAVNAFLGTGIPAGEMGRLL
ncbi:MAG: phenylalanine--tRNA ligase subunit beta, partial [Firmicutes bacterium]|nr:phenylalanine--tRNA ligase subunit beta [Bacillota bacterium]